MQLQQIRAGQPGMKQCDNNVLLPSPAGGPVLNNPVLRFQQSKSSQPVEHSLSPHTRSTNFAPEHKHSLCQADVCCRAPAAITSPQPHHIQHSKFQQAPGTPAALPMQLRLSQNSHKQALSTPETSFSPLLAQHDSHKSNLPTALTACHPSSAESSAESSCSTDKHADEAGKQLLWWPLNHVTLQGSRLAFGDSCYVITGDCVVCNVDDELAMVECTCCKRFTHFQCACPKLTTAPEVDFMPVCQPEV